MDMSNHPTPATQADNPRERIVAALRQRAEAASAPEAAANLPALPTILSLAKDALPGDHTRAPQTEFTRARQVLFIENLSTTGSARSASAAAGVSHQSAYRARRSCAQFRLAWDAALVAARPCVADALGCRAIDGVEEQVFYHGEVVATRRRYSDRLLLAHLARLDGLREDPRAAAFAEDWDAAMARFAAGEAPLVEVGPEPAEAPAGVYPEPGRGAGDRGEESSRVPAQAGTSSGGSQAPENFSSGPCNTWSKSNSELTPGDGEDEPDWEDEEEDAGEEEDDGIDWEDEDACNTELDRIAAAMEADRPADAPRLDANDPHGLIADAQWEAFGRKVPRWWLVMPPAPYGGEGEWHYAEAEAPAEAEAEPLEPANASCSPAQAGASGEGSPTLGIRTEPKEVPPCAGTRRKEPEPETKAEQLPEGEPQPEVHYRSWRPVNDGRLQPYSR